MNKLIRLSVVEVLQDILNELHTRGVLQSFAFPDIRIEATRDSKFGDVSSNIALLISGNEKKPAREISKLMVDCYNTKFSEKAKTISRMEIGGPGFINIFLGDQVWTDIVTDIINEASHYGVQDTLRKKVLIEFVSANPTGPLTLAHGRQAAVGDAV
ncbi:MAG: hypothetical protein Q8Q33_09350, partial [Chlamydiota bacterium]|nr:hypothetical protein [Chlamydiota bacterium]